MKDWLIGIGITGTILAALAGLIVFLDRAGEVSRPTPVYANGEFVQSVLSGQPGQVVWVWCYHGAYSCSYHVRFIGLSMTTSTSLLGPDGPVRTDPLSLVEMQEYELRPYKGN